MPRLLSSAAMARREVVPVALTSAMIGATRARARRSLEGRSMRVLLEVQDTVVGMIL
jgi:hypothetical protein